MVRTLPRRRRPDIPAVLFPCTQQCKYCTMPTAQMHTAHCIVLYCAMNCKLEYIEKIYILQCSVIFVLLPWYLESWVGRTRVKYISKYACIRDMYLKIFQQKQISKYIAQEWMIYMYCRAVLAPAVTESWVGLPVANTAECTLQSTVLCYYKLHTAIHCICIYVYMYICIAEQR